MKNIWIFNHYAGPPSICTGLRHFNFAKYLKQAGYKVTIFASSAQHNSSINLIKDDKKYIKYIEEDIPFVYIKTRQYKGNGKERIKNMVDYYKGVSKIADNFEKPDVIIGSSVHPLACLAAIKLSKKYQCKNIVEIRDLWPKTFVSLGMLSKDSFLVKLMYTGEKWLYKNAQNIVFTMEGGKDYVIDQGWSNSINLDKIYYINNGVDLEEFKTNIRECKIDDEDLDNKKIFKVIYAGSIRQANGLDRLIKVAEILKDEEHLLFLIYGDGPDKRYLEEYCYKNNINNVKFKGKIEKKYIPYVLSQSNLNILNYIKTDIFRYGTSQNKFFEYLASGKPICASLTHKYCVITKYKCGIAKDFNTINEYAEAILEIKNLSSQEYQKLCRNAQRAAEEYDFKNLTNKLIRVIEGEE